MAWVGGVGALQAAKEDWATWVEEEEEDLLAYALALEKGPRSPAGSDNAASVAGEAGKLHSVLVYRLLSDRGDAGCASAGS